MPRITLILTDEEYAALEVRAQAERRTPREMAAYLVARPEYVTVAPNWRQPFWGNPLYPPQITCGTTDATGTNTHTIWNSIGVNPDA